jgi:transcriptional regulator with XRE-family HTH domain
MARTRKTLFPSTERKATELGARIRAARRRRGISEAELAQRTLTSRPTIRRLEHGELNVSLAVLAQVLEVLRLESDLDRIAVDDELGHRVADSRLPRPRRTPEKSLADEL